VKHGDHGILELHVCPLVSLWRGVGCEIDEVRVVGGSRRGECGMVVGELNGMWSHVCGLDEVDQRVEVELWRGEVLYLLYTLRKGPEVAGRRRTAFATSSRAR
jgi:hypothetical protein